MMEKEAPFGTTSDCILTLRDKRCHPRRALLCVSYAGVALPQ
ncbi:hypothetical protein QNH14_03025 [Apirhabdus apintestini]|nr:hypothetical protein [Erwinia sp. HR93]MEA1063498.1 hypothetical protein [Erwinia sp. HR93]WPM85325.1 hypothetical protein QNH14_03025 [Enterobacteriaceae bacterium CA-0114]